MAARRKVRFGAWIRGPYLRVRLVCVLVLLALGLVRWCGSAAAAGGYNHTEILNAIRMTESSGRASPPDGDGGRAIGPYQIHKPYWIDSRIPGRYQQCRQREYAERVVRAYMRRYVAEAWQNRDAEVIARTHNGGPNGGRKTATQGYWRRVKRWLGKLPRQPES